MFIHSEKLNPCVKCGNKNPDLDSDDMMPCWMVQCGNKECDQSAHGEHWSLVGAVKEWNKKNPVNSNATEVSHLCSTT